MGTSDKAFAEKWFAENEEGLEGGWDAERRNKEMDNDGITAEVIFPDADAVESRTCAPFGVGLGLSGDTDPELGLAGAKAHNRWLAELCADSPERRKGVALVQITADARRRARRDPARPRVGAARRDDPGDVDEPGAVPLAALRPGVGAVPGPRDAGLHAQRSGRQGLLRRPPRHLRHRGRVVAGPADVVHVVVRRLRPLPAAEVRRHRSRLLVGARTCCGSGTGSTSARRAPRSSSSMGIQTQPSELFDRNCFIGSSNTKRREIGMRYEIGIDNMPWGNDFPHPEGTWPQLARVAGEDLPRRTDRRDASHDRRGRRGDLRLRPRVARAHAERINVTPASLGQTDDAANVARWAGHKEVGRHWLTGHDFPFAPVPG